MPSGAQPTGPEPHATHADAAPQPAAGAAAATPSAAPVLQMPARSGMTSAAAAPRAANMAARAGATMAARVPGAPPPRASDGPSGALLSFALPLRPRATWARLDAADVSVLDVCLAVAPLWAVWPALGVSYRALAVGVPGGPFGIVRPHLGEALMALVVTQALWILLGAAVGAVLAIAAPALGDALERGKTPLDVAATSVRLSLLVAGPVWLGLALRAVPVPWLWIAASCVGAIVAANTAIPALSEQLRVEPERVTPTALALGFLHFAVGLAVFPAHAALVRAAVAGRSAIWP